ncbi:MAG TPA: hypothetical protein DDW49_05030 [Deltaproteobacteria bacterium]|nr:hypothetical protein [Deltaproteobacteria bacterium]
MPYRNPSKKVAQVRIAGKDRKGIIATATAFLYKEGCNIEDIDQRLLDDYLTMNMLVDYSDLASPLPQFINKLKKAALTVGCEAEFNPLESKKIKNVALLVSKESHCLLNLLGDMKKKQIKGQPVVIIGNHPDLKSIAEKNKIPFYYVAAEKKKLHEARVLKILEKFQPDLIVLARYMQILSPEFVFRHEGKIINIHPSLLPAFPGPRPYHQAFNKGVEVIGVTAHFVTTDLDEGPIITQDCARIDKTKDTVDTFIAKGRNLEAKVLSRAVKLFVDDRLALRRGKVIDNKKLKLLLERTQQFYKE